MSLSDFLVRLVRTGVSAGVGTVLAWVATHTGVTEPTGAVATWATAVAVVLYWTIVAALERRWPSLGWLLGVPVTTGRKSKPRGAVRQVL